jgi:hypothetical protein
MKRFLTQGEAERCEMAQEPACKCRCGGEKHGAGRVDKGGDFSALPMDDPHYRPQFSKQQLQRILRNARLKVRHPILVDREQCIRDHGFEAWEQIRRQENEIFLETQRILTEALNSL